jgi:5-methylcytosine-specific restriction endonuclease McrA
MKQCSKCEEYKDISEYFVRDKATSKLHAQCKQCYKAHRQTFYAEHYAKYKSLYQKRATERRAKLRTEFRINMLAYLSNQKCAVCSESDIRVLELDHLNPLTKSFTVSQAVKLGRSWDEVLIEINKCQVLCANCHKRRTSQQFGWYKA